MTCSSMSLQRLTLKAPIATKVICFSRLLKFLRSLYGKQCGLRSDCSYRSSLIWVQAVCFYTKFVSNARQLFAANNFSRQHFQMHFFLGALRVKFEAKLQKSIILGITIFKNSIWAVYRRIYVQKSCFCFAVKLNFQPQIRRYYPPPPPPPMNILNTVIP